MPKICRITVVCFDCYIYIESISNCEAEQTLFSLSTIMVYTLFYIDAKNNLRPDFEIVVTIPYNSLMNDQHYVCKKINMPSFNKQERLSCSPVAIMSIHFKICSFFLI